MFGTSGVRGRIGDTVTPALALRTGAAVARDTDHLTVGRDPRLTGEALTDAVVAGALSTGATVERVGVAPTPTIARYAEDKSLVVTASHNPPEYNGFKPFNADGTAFDEEQRRRVTELVESPPKHVEASEFGEEFLVDDAINSHVQDVVESVDGADVKVGVDAGCGAASNVTPHVLRELGCGVVSVNCDVDGRFPARPPEPTEDNLTDLKNAVRAEDADLGLAHDGDADRTAAVDAEGRYVEPDRLLALLAEYLDADHVVVPLNTSMVVDEVTDVVRTRVGDVYVAEELRRSGGDFGGEPSNSWIFPSETYCPDGVHAAAVIAAMTTEEPLEDRLEELPSFEVRRGNHECRNKEAVMRRVESIVKENHSEYTDVDGVRVEVADGWFLVRPSGTEPIVRVTAEARDTETAEGLYDDAERIVMEAMDE